MFKKLINCKITIRLLWSNPTDIEMKGVGVGQGGYPPPITAQDPGICAFQGDPGWVLKRPPPKYQNVFYKLLLKLLNITRNKTSYKNKWVITKTVNCPGAITSQKYYDSL